MREHVASRLAAYVIGSMLGAVLVGVFVLLSWSLARKGCVADRLEALERRVAELEAGR